MNEVIMSGLEISESEKMAEYLKDLLKQDRPQVGVDLSSRTEKVFFIRYKVDDTSLVSKVFPATMYFGALFMERAAFEGMWNATAGVDAKHWVWMVYGTENYNIAGRLAKVIAEQYNVSINVILKAKEPHYYKPRPKMDTGAY